VGGRLKLVSGCAAGSKAPQLLPLLLCCCLQICRLQACHRRHSFLPPANSTALLLPCTTPRRLLLHFFCCFCCNPGGSHMLNTLPDTGLHSVPPAAAMQIILGARGIDRKVYGPYLLLLEAEQLAVLTMHSVINSIVAPEEAGGGAFSSPGQARVTRLSLNLGKVRGSGRTRWQARLAGGGEGRHRNTFAGGHILVGRTGMRFSLCALVHMHMQLYTHTPGTCPDPDVLIRCGSPIQHTPAATSLPCSLQAVEAQVNLEKLQAEAHTHNLLRAEVKDLYLQVGDRCTAGLLQSFWCLGVERLHCAPCRCHHLASFTCLSSFTLADTTPFLHAPMPPCPR
jgi:hypothetical protein